MLTRILLFARARELAGAGEISLELPEAATVFDLRRELVRAMPALESISLRLHVAINSEYAADSDLVPADAEIACFPPVSGG